MTVDLARRNSAFREKSTLVERKEKLDFFLIKTRG